MDPDDPIRANVGGLSVCFEPDLFRDALNDENEVSKFGMVASCMVSNPQSGEACKQDADSNLLQKFSTNDCMLRYRRIHSMFFTDMLFVIAKAAKST